MKIATKAALLSAFVFPGVGHIFLKKYISGLFLVGASLAATYYLISKAVENALQIVKEMQSGGLQLDIMAIAELVSRQSVGAESQLPDIATAAIIICWLVGIIGSYRVGSVRDKKNQLPENHDKSL